MVRKYNKLSDPNALRQIYKLRYGVEYDDSHSGNEMKPILSLVTISKLLRLTSR